MNRNLGSALLILLALLGVPVLLLARLPLAALALLFLLILLLLLLLLPERKPAYRPEDYFVSDQVVVSGPLQAVTAVIAQLNQAKTHLREVRRVQVGTSNQQLLDCLSGCFDITLDDFVIILYDISGSEADVAAVLRAIQRAAGPGSGVTASPNWITASPWQAVGSQFQAVGSPWQAVGSPWQAVGSPWQAVGSPWQAVGSTAGGEAQAAPAALFMGQWAFRNINLPARPAVRGSQVRIALFDTSPIADAQAQPGMTVTVSTVTAPAPLVIDPENPAPAAQLAADPTAPDVRNHGIFAAGMAHAVAPGAEKELIRVLANDNRGDLFTLNSAIFDFLNRTTGDNKPADLLGAVINLSLGIRLLPEEAGLGIPPEAQSLQLLLTAARCLGVVVVAAAGNNSAGLDVPVAANLPANWPAVIGVAASNGRDARACFSNRGNIAAPGGDGRSAADADCLPRLADCSGDCENAVIGPVIDANYPEGFIYWVGSSFAAPLVAGLAALVIERGGGQLSPRDVWRIIACAARQTKDPALGAGIIDVGETLARFDDCVRALGIVLPGAADKEQISG
ncbi:MAG: S8 family serine peptidase [Anaerolineales bacterium]|nr:S8 family serine peptidase [Anaerolineales bacterium]